jgi:hypothetical protein
VIVKNREKFYSVTDKKDFDLLEKVSALIMEGGYANYQAAEIILLVREYDSK